MGRGRSFEAAGLPVEMLFERLLGQNCTITVVCWDQGSQHLQKGLCEEPKSRKTGTAETCCFLTRQVLRNHFSVHSKETSCCLNMLLAKGMAVHVQYRSLKATVHTC